MFQDPTKDKYGYEKCDCCEGTGNFGSECCNALVTESGLCTACAEHAELEKCDCCNGEGEVKFDREARKQEAYENHLESMFD